MCGRCFFPEAPLARLAGDSIEYAYMATLPTRFRRPRDPNADVETLKLFTAKDGIWPGLAALAMLRCRSIALSIVTVGLLIEKLL